MKSKRQALSIHLSRLRLAAGPAAVMATLLCAGCSRKQPSTSEVREFLNANLPLNFVKVDSVKEEGFPLEADKLKIKFVANAELTVPLYESKNPIEFIVGKLGYKKDKADEARTILTGGNGARILALAGYGKSPPDAASVDLEQLVSAKGMPFEFTGSLIAERIVDGWKLAVDSIDDYTFKGKPLVQGAAKSYNPDIPSDVSELRSMVAADGDFAYKILTANAQFEAQAKAEAAKRLTAFLEAMPPGTIYAGAAVDSTDKATPLFLEITSIDPGLSRFQALLRNDGSWDEARPVDGSWDDQSGSIVTSLKLAGDNAIDGAGPILSLRQSGLIPLKFRDSTLTGLAGTYRFKLVRIDRDQASKLAAEIAAPAERVWSVLQPSSAFQGVIIDKRKQYGGPVILRVLSVDRVNSTIAMELQSQEFPGLLASLSGKVVSNKYRSKGDQLQVSITSRGDYYKYFSNPHVLPVFFFQGTHLGLKVSDNDITASGPNLSYRFEIPSVR
jgi:hypothetical protein